ncbi:hypothetical protein P3X46_021739 [Hevea brasiliensis]|uniref:VQ domain-containing protein n=1 Tax=Hevea brasiliensis TaxID=3981 RepID=A0ABQ9LIG8_HEVBR|nr:hypothetical protein P3X46_021739 [Hevea brasiliensis]
MGKKVISKASLSGICKNIEKQKQKQKQKQQQFRSNLIKVLRPKVYITDASNFKKLVQELTGNNAIVSTVPPLPCDIPNPEINKQEDFQIPGDQESCMEVSSFDASIDSLDSWNQLVLKDEEINQSRNQVYEDANATIAAVDASENPHMDLSAAGELESWLLDMEPCSFDNNGYLHQIEQDISTFDYYQLCELM